MRSAYNFVPAIMGMLLMLICAMMTSISIVREKEKGTMEILLVSPTKPLLIILAKVVPYLVVSVAILVIILLLSAFVLAVPIAGSLWWIFLVSGIYILLALSLGLLVSNLVKTQFGAPDAYTHAFRYDFPTRVYATGIAVDFDCDSHALLYICYAKTLDYGGRHRTGAVGNHDSHLNAHSTAHTFTSYFQKTLNITALCHSKVFCRKKFCRYVATRFCLALF